MPLTAAWWNAPAFYPSPGVFAFSENLLGLAPITAPVIAVTHSALAGYNVAFLLSYLLSGLGAYLLAFVLTRRHDASFVAGAAFAFAPYRLSHTQHLQLLSSYWMPVAIAALHQYFAAPRWRWAAVFAGSWLLQALACGYYLFFLTILCCVARVVRAGAGWRDGARLAIAWGAAGLRSPGPARVPRDPRVLRIQAQPGRGPQLQRRHRGTVVGGAGLADVGLDAAP